MQYSGKGKHGVPGGFRGQDSIRRSGRTLAVPNFLTNRSVIRNPGAIGRRVAEQSRHEGCIS